MIQRSNLSSLLINGLLVGAIAMWLRNDAYLIRTMATDLHMNDFGKFYYSAVAFTEGRDMYAPNAATLMPVDAELGVQFLNLNPPHFHLLIWPLTYLSPLTALALWVLAGLAALSASLALVIRELGIALTPRRFLVMILMLLAFTGTGAMLITGQLVWLLLAPMTLMWLEARRGRWNRAGLYLGFCMGLKPFLLVFLPFLLLRRRFKAAALACATAALGFVVGLAVFGLETHAAWIATLGKVDWAWAAMNSSLLGILSRSFTSNPHFTALAQFPVAVKLAWLILSCLLGGVTLRLAALDDSETGVDRGFALMLVLAQLTSPLGWTYYWWLLLGPAIALTQAAYRARVREAQPMDRAVAIRNALAACACLGLVWPTAYTLWLQPQAWATSLFGSAFFWTNLALWLALVFDFLQSNAHFALRRALPLPSFARSAASAFRGSYLSR